jgi:hypothetical protein
MQPMIDQLTDRELNELSIQEQKIESSLDNFLSIGLALSKIREERLYRSSHPGFEEYTRNRWGISRSQAYRLIDSSKIVTNLRGNGLPLPTNERQTRPLNLLEPDIQVQAWEEAVKTSSKAIPTASHVAEIVAKYLPRSRTSSAKNHLSPNGGLFDPHSIEECSSQPSLSIQPVIPESNTTKLTLSGWIQKALEYEGQCFRLKAHIEVLDSKVKQLELLLQQATSISHN